MSCSATPYMLERHRGALSARMSTIWDSLGRWRPPPRSSTRHRTRTGSSGAQLDVSFESAGHQARCQAYAPNSGQTRGAEAALPPRVGDWPAERVAILDRVTTLDEREGPRDECGVFGIHAPGHDVS